MEGNSFELKGISLENKGTPNSNCKPIIRVPHNKVLEGHHSNITRQGGKSHKNTRGHAMKRRVVMKSQSRRVRVPQQGGEDRGIETRVRTLKSLIPSHESGDLEGLFRVTAEYIVGLQTRVRVMQMMVDALTTGSHLE